MNKKSLKSTQRNWKFEHLQFRQQTPSADEDRVTKAPEPASKRTLSCFVNNLWEEIPDEKQQVDVWFPSNCGTRFKQISSQ